VAEAPEVNTDKSVRRAPNPEKAAAKKAKTAETAAEAPAKARRKASNYPKCAWPECAKNRSPRTIPYCGEHSRAAKTGSSTLTVVPSEPAANGIGHEQASER
jgi:hypothetical protein